MARKANRQNKSKQRKFRDAKKKMQRIKLQDATRIPKKQYNRWPTNFAPLATELVETERDPDYVAFCVARTASDEEERSPNELEQLWLRVAAALRLGMYTLKAVDRTGKLRPFDKEIFTKAVEENDAEHEVGLRYEADKFLCYLLYGDNPRFRELFAYILLPWISNDLPKDLDMMQYNLWIATEPTADLTKRLVEFDMAEVG